MMKVFILTLFSASFSGVFLSQYQNSSSNFKTWAVLVAGADGWSNYMFQASVCHAYQVLHNHGIPDERIVVMMKDDIAYNPKNPTPGVIVNRPGGPDVYKGVPKDYTGEDATPRNFMAVLKGVKRDLHGAGSGKVIDSKPSDRVFVYIADHGAEGLVVFPNELLTAIQLYETISYMHKFRRYKEMVIYLEACHSGSMFEDILPDHIKVFAITSSNPYESSYGCCHDAERDAWVGSLYSNSWLEDSDQENLLVETLNKQYEKVKEKVKLSHVQRYGDLSVGPLRVSEFQGDQEATPIKHPQETNDFFKTNDVDLELVKKKISRASNPEERRNWEQVLQKMKRNRKFLSDKVKELVDNLAIEDPSVSDVWDKRMKIKDFDCYDEVREYFHEECFNIIKNHYALDFMHVLVNLCEHGVDSAKQKQAMEKVCKHPPVYGVV